MSPASGLKTLHCQWESPDFYSVADVEELFRTAEVEDPQIIFDLALRFFAGVRTDEIKRMEKGDYWWDDFSINVRKEVAKSKSPNKPLPRLIQNLPDTFWEWMLALGGEDFFFELCNRQDFQSCRCSKNQERRTKKLCHLCLCLDWGSQQSVHLDRPSPRKDLPRQLQGPRPGRGRRGPVRQVGAELYFSILGYTTE